MTSNDAADRPVPLPVAGGTDWESPSTDPNDETFGDVVSGIDRDGGHDALDDYAAVLVGEPFDAAVIGRRGAAGGPDAIRDSLTGVKTHRFGRDPPMNGTIGDLGNVVADAGSEEDSDRDALREAARSVATRVHGAAVAPVFLGGDNSLTVPNVEPLLAAAGPDETVGVCNLDAHLDVREVRGSYTSGTPYRELLEAGLDVYVVAGARDFETSTVYADFVDEHDGTVVTADELGRDPTDARDRIREALAAVDHLYVSVDCDVLDAPAAPGVSAPTPGGLTSRELFGLVDDLVADPRLRGFEVVECAPPLDEDGRTVDVAARTVARALSVIGGAGEVGGEDR